MLPLQSFKDYVQAEALFAPEERVLIAVSGGRDSVLLAHLFKACGYSFGIGHCNFNLRAAESLRDQNFVKMLAASLGVPFYLTQFQTEAYAKAHGVSTQMAARTLRYSWFEQIRASEGYDLIALGQHQDDVIETLLLNLTRGTGIAGLHGIFPKRGMLVRPLLFMTRTEIDEIVQKSDIKYVEDSSNQTTKYARNRIRQEVIPVLKSLNPNLEQTFRQNTRRFAETEILLQHVTGELSAELLIQGDQGEISISIDKIRELVPRQLLLFELLRTYGFSESVVGDLLKAIDTQSGKLFYSSSHRILIDRGQLMLSQFPCDRPFETLIRPGDTIVKLPRGELKLYYSDRPFFEKNVRKAFIDVAGLVYPLKIRTWQRGDRFIPIGMRNYKKLSDFFIDEKIPLTEKEKIPVVVNGNGDIIWIVGWRQDDRYKVKNSTERITVIEFETGHIALSKIKSNKSSPPRKNK